MLVMTFIHPNGDEFTRADGKSPDELQREFAEWQRGELDYESEDGQPLKLRLDSKQ